MGIGSDMGGDGQERDRDMDRDMDRDTLLGAADKSSKFSPKNSSHYCFKTTKFCSTVGPGGSGVTAANILILGTRWWLSGQLHSPAALSPRKNFKITTIYYVRTYLSPSSKTTLAFYEIRFSGC